MFIAPWMTSMSFQAPSKSPGHQDKHIPSLFWRLQAKNNFQVFKCSLQHNSLEIKIKPKAKEQHQLGGRPCRTNFAKPTCWIACGGPAQPSGCWPCHGSPSASENCKYRAEPSPVVTETIRDHILYFTLLLTQNQNSCQHWNCCKDEKWKSG